MENHGVKIHEQMAAYEASHPGKKHFSVEFFPPKTDEGVKNLEARFERYQTKGIDDVIT